MKYIITSDIQIKNTPDQLIYVLKPEQIINYQNTGYKYRERFYKITLSCIPCEIVCAEIWKKGDLEHSVVMPAFLTLRRPHPLYVYVYAINLYSGSPKMSLRAAATATKEKFKIKSFSHTTLARAMKKLSGTLEENKAADISFGAIESLPEDIEGSTVYCETADTDIEIVLDAAHDPLQVTTADSMPVASKVEGGSSGEQKSDASDPDVKGSVKRFPTKKDTQKRRETIREFYEGKIDIHICQGFEEACARLAIWWHAQFGRLLI